MKRQMALFTLLLTTVSAPCVSARKPMQARGLLDDLYVLRDSHTARISSWDRSGGNADWIVIPSGTTSTLAQVSEAGVIRRFYMAVMAPDRMRYRKAILRMYWDGHDLPCVEVPLGDFFGSGLGVLRYFQSLAVNVNPGEQGRDFDGVVNYLPMPFEKGALITVENDGNIDNLRIWYHIDMETYPGGKLPPDSGRLHAQWRRVARTPVRPENKGRHADLQNLTGGDNFLILDAEGQGSYVGLFLTVDNISGGWYGEGDDMIFVDGEKWPPSFAGTGHEELFNAGCCPDREFSGPYTGFYLIENREGNFGGKNQMYRFFLSDPVRFQKSIRVTLEHGHANNLENDYTSTAFWYQKDPHKAFPVLPPATTRLPQWPEAMAHALEQEVSLWKELDAISRKGIRLSPSDGELVRALGERLSHAFRDLDYPAFVDHVSELNQVIERNRPGGSDE